MALAYICSPLKSYFDAKKAVDVTMDQNIELAKSFCVIAMGREYIPIAPHLYFTQFLDDGIESHRAQGLAMGLNVLKYCSVLLVFGEYISAGMRAEIDFAKQNYIDIEYIK